MSTGAILNQSEPNVILTAHVTKVNRTANVFGLSKSRIWLTLCHWHESLKYREFETCIQCLNKLKITVLTYFLEKDKQIRQLTSSRRDIQAAVRNAYKFIKAWAAAALTQGESREIATWIASAWQCAGGWLRSNMRQAVNVICQKRWEIELYIHRAAGATAAAAADAWRPEGLLHRGRADEQK